MAVESLTIGNLLATLDACGDEVDLEALVDHLHALNLTLDDVNRFAKFGRETYQRNLMHAGPGYHALILCWRAGQRSPIHDHRGSSCAVRVITGVATETVFDRTPDGFIFPTHTRELQEGDICGSHDADIHQMSNLQPDGCDLITLHVYAPPLLRMNMYSLTEARVSEFADPVVGFEMGDGI